MRQVNKQDILPSNENLVYVPGENLLIVHFWPPLFPGATPWASCAHPSCLEGSARQVNLLPRSSRQASTPCPLFAWMLLCSTWVCWSSPTRLWLPSKCSRVIWEGQQVCGHLRICSFSHWRLLQPQPVKELQRNIQKQGKETYMLLKVDFSTLWIGPLRCMVQPRRSNQRVDAFTRYTSYILIVTESGLLECTFLKGRLSIFVVKKFFEFCIFIYILHIY